MSRIILRELTTAPATPVTGKLAVYCKNDGKLYVKNAAGVETAVGGGTGGGAVTVDPLELAHRTVNIGGTTGKTKLFAKDDNQLYFTDGNGAVSRVARFSEIPAVPVIDPLALTERATDPASQTGKVVVYGKTDNRLYARGEDGVISKLAFVSEIAAAGGYPRLYMRKTGTSSSPGLAHASGAIVFNEAGIANTAFYTVINNNEITFIQAGTYRAVAMVEPQVGIAAAFRLALDNVPVVGGLSQSGGDPAKAMVLNRVFTVAAGQKMLVSLTHSETSMALRAFFADTTTSYIYADLLIEKIN